MRIEHFIRRTLLNVLIPFALATGFSGATGKSNVSTLTPVSQQSGERSSLTDPSTGQLAKIQVLALDKNYQPVTDMKPEDFRLTQNKREVKVVSAQLNASGSLDFAFLFDLSGSRKNDPKFHDEFAEASDFLRRIWQSGDVATIAAFNDGAHVVMPATSDVNRAIRVMNSLSSLSPNGSTALYDAICSAVIDPNSASASRKVVLIFSDFDDDSSRNTERQGIDCTSKGQVPIYSFVILNEPLEHREMTHDVKTAREFSENSGGVAFDTKSASELPDSLSQLSQFLRSSYEVSFNTSPAKAGNHAVLIDVETTRPGITLYFARHYYEQ